MIRVVSIVAFSSLLGACQSAPQPVHDLTRLASIQSIYVDDLGKEKDADLIEGSKAVREEIMSAVARSERFALVQSPEQADAVLTGLAGFEKWYHGMEGFYGLEGDLDSHYLGVGQFRLVDTKTNRTIWTHKYQPGLLRPTQSVVERVAEQVVDKLLNDAKHVDNSSDRIAPSSLHLDQTA